MERKSKMRTPNKQRYLNAVKHIETKEVSFGELEFGPGFMSKVLGRRVPIRYSFEQSPRDVRELLEKIGCDMLFIHYLWKLGRMEKIVSRKEFPQYIDGTMKHELDLKHITYPSLDDIRRRIEQFLEEIRDTDIGTIFLINATPFIVTTAIGYEDYYLALIDRPGFVKEFQKRVNEFVINEVELVLSYPIDCLMTSLIVSDCSGPMMSEEMLEEFEFPFIKQVSDMTHTAGIPLAIHADGNNTSLMPRIIELGVNIIEPIEPCNGCQNVFKLKQKYGDKITLHGSIDISGILQYGTPEKVRENVLYHLDQLSPGGGYVCASSHEILDSIPLNNFWAMANTVTNYQKKLK